MPYQARVTLAGDRQGMHIRPAFRIAKRLEGIDAAIVFTRDDLSIPISARGPAEGLLRATRELGLGHGATFELTCEGPEAARAFAALREAFTQAPFEGSEFTVLDESAEPPPPATHRGTILFVDDEKSSRDFITPWLHDLGYHVLEAALADEALGHIDAAERIDLALLDMQLPQEGCTRGPLRSASPRELGLVLAKQLRRKFRDVPVVFCSGSSDDTLQAKALGLGNARFFLKSDSLDRVVDTIDALLSGTEPRAAEQAFIVHGHDEETRHELERFIHDGLGIADVVVLKHMRTGGETLIEKLERFALATDLVFVLLTPDDRVVPSESNGVETRRARQNVIFEMGYFLGRLKRRTGRVVLLAKGDLELPSDIAGMVAIDISSGIAGVANEIRNEISRGL